MKDQCDWLINAVNVASMQDNGAAYGSIKNATVAVGQGKILYVGDSTQCPYNSERIVDGKGQWMTPGLVDCHTHLIYGGNRATEFEQRLQGVSYADIANQGGGIKSTVKATREASFEALLSSATQRATCLLQEGVTTVEVKSGYGLDLNTEIKMLEVARALNEQLPMTVQTSFLGAHALPLEYQGRADEYIDFVCDTVMPEVAARGLASCVDVFCESIGFSLAQTQRVFQAAQRHGLAIKAHVEQLTDLKGAVLAAQYGALSVDHIEYLAVDDVPLLKQSDTVAVLLPGAFYYLNESQKPPIAALRAHNVPMAVATDLNPGSSPLASLLSAMNMACVLFGLTPEEALRGATVNGADALGLKSKGVIAPQMDADFCLWDIQHPSELAYAMGMHRPTQIWIGGCDVSV